MEAIIQGPALCLGQDVNTDDIIPARHLVSSEPEFLAGHLFEDMAEEIKVGPGAIIVAGANFGSGSSREHAPVGLKAAGVQAILAESLARIFVRNCINIGLLALEAPGVSAIGAGQVRLDLTTGKITGSAGEEVEILPVPDFIRQIIDAGGLIPWIRTGGLD